MSKFDFTSELKRCIAEDKYGLLASPNDEVYHCDRCMWSTDDLDDLAVFDSEALCDNCCVGMGLGSIF